MFESKRFSITHEAMGSIEVFLGVFEMRHYKECKTERDQREFIAHEAWRKLWESDAKHMLKRLCDSQGVDAVKRKFTDAIIIEEIP